MEKFKQKYGIVILCIIGLILLSKSIDYKHYLGFETWQGFFYPRGCLWCQSEYIYSPVFNDRTDCLAWGSKLKAQRNIPEDKYECGKNCKAPESKDGLYVCETTVDY